ncbi:PEP-CTERM sorting domain-containing protein [bacterium]|nr:PEP-CTERM sorting domain-containing protein [bacterium]
MCEKQRRCPLRAKALKSLQSGLEKHSRKCLIKKVRSIAAAETTAPKLTLVYTVPEPSSLSLLLAGGAVLMAGRRRNCGNEDS